MEQPSVTTHGHQQQQPPESNLRSTIRGLIVVEMIHNIYSIFILFAIVSFSIYMAQFDVWNKFAIFGLIYSVIIILVVILELIAVHNLWGVTQQKFPPYGRCNVDGSFYVSVILIIATTIALIILVSFDMLRDLFYYAFCPFTFSITLRIVFVYFTGKYTTELMGVRGLSVFVPVNRSVRVTQSAIQRQQTYYPSPSTNPVPQQIQQTAS